MYTGEQLTGNIRPNQQQEREKDKRLENYRVQLFRLFIFIRCDKQSVLTRNFILEGSTIALADYYTPELIF